MAAAADVANAVELECSTYAGPMRWRWNPGGRGAKTQTLRALPLADAPALRGRAPPLRSFPARELRLLLLNALASGMFYRIAGVLSVHLQREAHGLTAAAFFPEAGLSRE